jgi:hypothetical protein
MNVQSIIRIGLVVGLAACGFEPGDDGGVTHGQRRVLTEIQAGEVQLAAAHAGDPMPLVEPAVTAGTVIVRGAGDHLVLEELIIELGDVDVVKRIGTTTQVLHLTDLRLRLGTQAETDPSGVASADLLLDWSLRGTDGRVLPLAMQRVRGAAFEVHVDVDAETDLAIASVSSSTPGLLWELGDITVSDLSLSLVTAETGDLP